MCLSQGDEARYVQLFKFTHEIGLRLPVPTELSSGGAYLRRKMCADLGVRPHLVLAMEAAHARKAARLAHNVKI